jgi:hypothetical protein
MDINFFVGGGWSNFNGYLSSGYSCHPPRDHICNALEYRGLNHYTGYKVSFRFVSNVMNIFYRIQSTL